MMTSLSDVDLVAPRLAVDDDSDATILRIWPA